jgi:hypothetical protein
MARLIISKGKKYHIRQFAGYPKDECKIEIKSNNIIKMHLCLEVINKDDAKEIISFLQNHFSL